MKSVLLLLVAAFIITSASAQDVITKTNGDEIACHIVRITLKNIKYHGTTDTVLHSISKKEVFMLKYENGVKEVFNETHVDDNDAEGHWDKRSMAQQGREDADQYYKRWHGGKAAGAWGGFLGGAIIGLIPTIAAASTPPRDKRLGCPHPDLMKNQEYAHAYRKEAHHIKRKKTWGGYGVGVGIWVAAVIIVAII